MSEPPLEEHSLSEQDNRFLEPLRGKGQRPSDKMVPITAAGFRKMLARLELPAELVALAHEAKRLGQVLGRWVMG